MGGIRSGTTLLQSLLDGHPEIVVDAGESRFFTRNYHRLRFRTTRQRIAIARKDLLHIFQPGNDYHAKYLRHVSAGEVHRLFERNLRCSDRRLSDYLPSYVLAYGEASGQLSEKSRFWVEKTPYSEYYSELILRWYPEARVIFVVRDPRDVFCSINVRARRKKSYVTASSFSFTWSTSVRQVGRIRTKLGDDGFLAVRYEDLTARTRETMERIRTFLAIADDIILLTPSKGGGAVSWEGNRASHEKAADVSPPVRYDWQSLMSQRERDTLSRRLYTDASTFGYQLPTPCGGTTLREWFLDRLRQVHFMLRHRVGVGSRGIVHSADR